MLLHLVPEFNVRNLNGQAHLVSVCIPELSLTLDNTQIRTGSPYADAPAVTACSTKEQKDVQGLFIEVDNTALPNAFTLLYTWTVTRVDQPVIDVVHEIKVSLLERKFDAISFELLNWTGHWPTHLIHAPLAIAPIMSLNPIDSPSSVRNVQDTLEKGVVVHRLDTLSVPSLPTNLVRQGLYHPAPTHIFTR